MIVYPAMDLMGGRVVRLRQGRFEDSTFYPVDPTEALQGFEKAGAEWAHVVDLDGARAGTPVQHQLIALLARSTKLKLQVGGGFRSRADIARMLDAGVERVVIGSMAVQQPELVASWLDDFGADRITLSIDVRTVDESPRVAVAGWTEESELTLWDVASRYQRLRHLLVTDIGRDGMLQGPNFALLEQVVQRLPNVRVQASGGVSAIEDIELLHTDGVIVGKALWEGRVRLEEILSLDRA